MAKVAAVQQSQSQEKPAIPRNELGEIAAMHTLTVRLTKIIQSWVEEGRQVEAGLLNTEGEPITIENFREAQRAGDPFVRALGACIPAGESLRASRG
jgi:hypothetical protein